MTSRWVFTALASMTVAGTLMASAQAPANAQVVRIPQAAPDRMLPPHEVMHIVRAHGLDLLGAPVLRGVTYRARAIDRAGRDVNVVVDARFGDVLLVERADGPYPERRIAAMPPGYDDPDFFDERPEPYSALPPPYPPRVIKPTPRVATVPAQKTPPLPKPRPEAVAAQTAAPAQAAPSTTASTPKSEAAPVKDTPTKWQDEPAPTNAPAAAPKVPDVAPLE